MPYEDIQVRIGRDGKVYLFVDGVSEDRIRNLRQFLEEQIGPIQSMEIVRKPDWEHPVERAAEDANRRRQDDAIKLDRGGK